MSLEIHNERIAKFAKSLPGRDDNALDTSRGYVGWGPGEDSTCGDRTVEHADWPSALAELQNPAREIHDFYFDLDEPSKTCDCCAGSGKNKEYAELYRGFYRHGGGRWAGWGDGQLQQNEIDALIDRGRLRGEGVLAANPANLKEFLGPLGHDSINMWILVPVRAKNLGIDMTDCFECVGTGLIPTAPARLQLHLWTFDPASGTSRVDSVQNVAMNEVVEVREYLHDIGWEGVKRRFGWPAGDNMHPSIRYEENFSRDPSRPFEKQGWFDSAKRYASFNSFKYDWGIDGDTDLNLIFDYRIVADAQAIAENPFSGSELPDEFSLEVVMSHPRKGADCFLRIDGCTAADGQEIKDWLRRTFEVHGRHFAWSVGREFGNEATKDDGGEPDGYNPMKLFAGM